MQMDASGMGDPTTGSSTLSLALSSRVYLTSNLGSPCPHCVSGACTYGPHEGAPCTTTTSSTTSIDCPPEMGGGAFQAPLPVTLNPFTTEPTVLMAEDGIFCPPDQRTPGAFGQCKRCSVTSAQCCVTDTDCMAPACGTCGPSETCTDVSHSAKRIAVSGTRAGDLTDGMPHASVLATAFCIPATNNVAVDGVASLPGPGVTTIPGMAQLH